MRDREEEALSKLLHDGSRMTGKIKATPLNAPISYLLWVIIRRTNKVVDLVLI